MEWNACSSSARNSFCANLTCLRAAREAGTAEGETVVRRMGARPIDDLLSGMVTIRQGGRAVHDVYRYRGKALAGRCGRSDDYTLVTAIPGAEGFRPLDEGGCAVVR